MLIIANIITLGGIALSAAGLIRLFSSSAPGSRSDMARELLLSVAILALALMFAELIGSRPLSAAIALGYVAWLWRRSGGAADRE